MIDDVEDHEDLRGFLDNLSQTVYTLSHYLSILSTKIMARICSTCGKGSKKAANRSHSKMKTLRRQNPNLQKVDGSLVCTACIRTTAKQLR